MTRTGIQPIAIRLTWCLMTLGLVATLCRAEQPDPTLTELARRAAAAEKAALTNDSLAAYSRLMACDPSMASVIGPRLVELEASRGDPAAALRWAASVAQRHPQPDAYMAGVYARLGQWQDAERMLIQASRRETAPARRIPLLWQLADAQEKQGDSASAQATLTRAIREAASPEQKATAEQRLNALQRRLPDPDATARQKAEVQEGTP